MVQSRKQLLGQLGNVAEKNDADIIAGDFDIAACRERRNVKVSSIRETCEEMLLIPPPVRRMKKDCQKRNADMAAAQRDGRPFVDMRKKGGAAVLSANDSFEFDTCRHPARHLRRPSCSRSSMRTPSSMENASCSR